MDARHSKSENLGSLPELSGGQSPSSVPGISIVLPAYNEAEAIHGAITEAVAALSTLTDDYEVIVVDDGSRDATATVARELAAANPAIKILSHERTKDQLTSVILGLHKRKVREVSDVEARSGSKLKAGKKPAAAPLDRTVSADPPEEEDILKRRGQ